jgi:predicted kinase
MPPLTTLQSLKPLKGLVLLIGPPGAGKTTFAKKLIAQHIIEDASYVSNDAIAKELFGVAVDRGDKDGAIFAEQDRRVALLLGEGEAAVVDATNVRSEARQRLITIAKEFDAPIIAFCFRRDVAALLGQNKGRDVEVPEQMVLEYAALMQQVTAEQLRREGVLCAFDVAEDA